MQRGRANSTGESSFNTTDIVALNFSWCAVLEVDRKVWILCKRGEQVGILAIVVKVERVTLGPVVAGMEKLTGVEVRRIHVDKGYRGHSYGNKFRIWTSGQVRRVAKTIRREMRRRVAVEPVIGHVKAEHRTERNHLKGHEGDRANAVVVAAGYNFSLLLRWFEALLRALIAALLRAALTPQTA
jgi:hypothetical protein